MKLDLALSKLTLVPINNEFFLPALWKTGRINIINKNINNF